MSGKKSSDADFIELYRKHGAQGTARILNQSVRGVQGRRSRLERRMGIDIVNPLAAGTRMNTRVQTPSPSRITIDIENGYVLVFSDAHYWPGIVTTAHRGLVRLTKKLKPAAIIANGDILDGATISRHAPIGWEDRPSLVNELEACQDRLDEIMKASPSSRRLWSLGNHDARFESRLAQVVPEFAKVHGTDMATHFPMWDHCLSVVINNEVVIKHRYKGGIHATHNNTVYAGKTIVTGHLHSLKVTPFDDYNGTRWGVDTGTLADPHGPQFHAYMEDNPRNWRSGFAILQFIDKKLMWPEIVPVVDENHIFFRGELIWV